MFMGIAAPYRGLSHSSRSFSLDPEEDEHRDNGSPLSTGMDCSSDHQSLSDDQDFSEFLKNHNSYEIRRQSPQAQGDPLKLRPRTFNSSCKSPQLNPASLAHQEFLSNSTTYSIKGLGVTPSCPQALFRPIVRVYPPPYGRSDKSGSSLDYLHASPFIEHIDITTVWKGLLLSDAQQLLYLDRTFKDSLEDLIADALDTVHEEFQQQCVSYHDLDIEVLATSSMNRRLSFDLRHLVLSMNQRLKLCGKLPEKGSMRDFSMLLPLFLISCDCLIGFEGGITGDTAVDICVHHCDPSNYTFPRGPVPEAAWIPDRLSFNGVSQIQREGQELIIIPRYCGNAAFKEDITRTNVQFFIESPETWLVWDKEISGFRGNVPLFSEMGCVRRPGKVYKSPEDGPYAMINVLRVEIKALLTAGCHSPVRLERTIRARLTFKIVPWFAHDSACAPTDDLVRPIFFHYPDCDSPAPSSTSSRLEGEIEPGSPMSNIVSDNTSQSVSSRNSRVSSTERLLAGMSLQSSQMLPRKRRAVSSLEIPSPPKRHRETKNKRPVIGSFNPHNKHFSIPNIKEEVDKCRSRSATPDANSSCSLWTLHSRENLSPLYSDTHIASSDFDDSAEVMHLEEDLASKLPFHENRLALAATSQTLDSVYAVHANHENSDVDDASTQQEILLDGRDIHPMNNSLGANMINEISQPKRVQRDELYNPKLRTCSDTCNSISHNSGNIHDQFNSSIGGSRQSSTTIEIIVENPDVDPQLRRERAILWNVLSTKDAQSKLKGETTSVDELKDIYAAMKLSVAEETHREMAKMGLGENFDDVFIASGNGSDSDMSMNDTPCP